MARYIDADILIEALTEEFEFEATLCTKKENMWFKRGINCAIRNVDRIPTADVEEVVRCKDCGRSAKYKDYYLCGVDNRAVNADSFCSYGERSDT